MWELSAALSTDIEIHTQIPSRLILRAMVPIYGLHLLTLLLLPSAANEQPQVDAVPNGHEKSAKEGAVVKYKPRKVQYTALIRPMRES